jgi:hypothetical protein
MKMSSDFFCPRCRKIHSYRMSFCPSDAREPTSDEIEENTYFMALHDNRKIDSLHQEIRKIKGHVN